MLFLFPDNAPQVATTAPGSGNRRNSSTGPTPDCSPPSPDTALKNIVKVIRPQVGDHLLVVAFFILKAGCSACILGGCCHYMHMNRYTEHGILFLYLRSSLESWRR